MMQALLERNTAPLQASLEHPFLADLHRASPLLPAEAAKSTAGRQWRVSAQADEF